MVKTVFITGANRGLGLGLARELLSKDFLVFAGVRAANSLELEELKADYPDSLEMVRIDVTDQGMIERAKAAVEERANKLDWLINNAAILGNVEATARGPLDFGDMMATYNTNTLGPLRVTNAFLPLLLKGESKLVVNISSEAGSIADCQRTNNFSYCMSKAALNMQSSLVHNQLKELGGGVLVLHPGWVQTCMPGKLDTAATLTPAQSASQLVNLITQNEKNIQPKPLFLDYQGRQLPW
ncbi:SDR family oxidoreductase [Bacillus sp. B-jedd]|uniref:SDR family oxidoreductase n=1 Tax=Bacillus sp. B-jedd TaxID=1476857 RepID=UPI0005155FD2|nr:SDR family oxidoreductase [Bacillus sp. B-jedd]CEG28570.1 short-chain dehydrogenase/reductase SDR [Bacillus sp. B-jedd]